MLYPSRGGLAPSPETGTAILSTPLLTGTTFGEWCPYGLEGELPQEKRPDDGQSLSLDLWLDARVEILGAPVVELTLVPDTPGGQIAARLPEGNLSIVALAATVMSWL